MNLILLINLALNKSEMINNIKPNGILILNGDDYFYEFHKKVALNRNLKIFSFSIRLSLIHI